MIAAVFAAVGVSDVDQLETERNVKRWKIPALVRAKRIRINFKPKTPFVPSALAWEIKSKRPVGTTISKLLRDHGRT